MSWRKNNSIIGRAFINQIKNINQDGDYYFCNICNEWHRYRTEPDRLGHQHITHFDEEKTNSPSAKYYFGGVCNKWYTNSTKEHLQNRLYIKRDDSIRPELSDKKLHVQQRRTGAHHSEEDEMVSIDAAASIWKSESELLLSIRSPEARRLCKSILALVKNLDKNLHIQYFSRKSGFSFIVKGLRIAEIRIVSAGFILWLIQNTKVPGSTRPRQAKKKLVFTGIEIPIISYSELSAHFTSEAKNLIYLREKNSIGYFEKWLHCLLIEKIQNDELSGLDFDFLFYEAPAAKIKRYVRPRHETIDILAKEQHSKALVVAEVKKQGEDLNSAVLQGLSYVGWLGKYKEELKPRILQLGWGVDIEKLKLMVIAPDMDFNNTLIDASILEQAKRLNCEVILISINSDWIRNEEITCASKNLSIGVSFE